MKIIHWNCQGAFRKKNAEILKYKPDIIIITECENPSRLKFGKLFPAPEDYFWYGDNVNKGVGFFFYNGVRYRINKDFNSKFRFIIPLVIEYKNLKFNLFGIWAMGDSKKRTERYVGQIWQAVNHYENQLKEPSILIGDFNSNQIWDQKKRIGNHTDVVNKLLEYDIHSLYHLQMSIQHGQELDPTFFLYRNVAKPYHLDYCFCSNSFLAKGYNFTIGDVEKWIEFSDHLPIFIDLNV